MSSSTRRLPMLAAAVIASATFALVACVATTPNLEPTLSLVDIPPLGETHTVEIGSSLVQKARVYQYEAYRLLEEYVWIGTGINVGAKITAPPGFYVSTRQSETSTYYFRDDVESCGLGICNTARGGFMINNESGDVRIFDTINSFKLDDAPNWLKTNYADVDQASFRRELLYNGRTGSTIRLLYREFSGNMARPAFTQELTYDIAEDSVIGFQGVRIEVLDTSNVDITYRVLSSFPATESR